MAAPSGSAEATAKKIDGACIRADGAIEFEVGEELPASLMLISQQFVGLHRAHCPLYSDFAAFGATAPSRGSQTVIDEV